MSDKITFLGTAGEREAVAKQIRASGGIIIQSEGNQFHINPGPGTTVRAKEFGVNLRETTCMIVTNSLLASCNDINAVIDATTHAGHDPKSVLLCAESVVNGEEPTLKKQSMQLLERVITLEPGQKVGINEVEIHAITAKNKEDPTAFGVKFYTPHHTITYTSDTQHFKEMDEEYADTDILIIALQTPLGEKNPNGINADEVVELIKKIKPALTILTGFGTKIINADVIGEARDMQNKTGCQVMAAKDGLSISPVGLAKKTRQQTLRKFEKDSKEDYEEADIEVEETDEEK